MTPLTRLALSRVHLSLTNPPTLTNLKSITAKGVYRESKFPTTKTIFRQETLVLTLLLDLRYFIAMVGQSLSREAHRRSRIIGRRHIIDTTEEVLIRQCIATNGRADPGCNFSVLPHQTSPVVEPPLAAFMGRKGQRTQGSHLPHTMRQTPNISGYFALL